MNQKQDKAMRKLGGILFLIAAFLYFVLTIADVILVGLDFSTIVLRGAAFAGLIYVATRLLKMPGDKKGAGLADSPNSTRELDLNAAARLSTKDTKDTEGQDHVGT